MEANLVSQSGKRSEEMAPSHRGFQTLCKEEKKKETKKENDIRRHRLHSGHRALKGILQLFYISKSSGDTEDDG